jgi:hypothetical protein
MITYIYVGGLGTGFGSGFGTATVRGIEGRWRHDIVWVQDQYGNHESSWHLYHDRSWHNMDWRPDHACRFRKDVKDLHVR